MAARLIVLAVSTGNQTLSGLSATADGVVLNTDNMRVLCVGQTNRIENGVWLVHSTAWTRPSDYAAASNQIGTVVTPSSGTRYTGSAWLCAVMPAIVGTDPTAWACAPSWLPPPSGSSTQFLNAAGSWATPEGGGGGGSGSLDGGQPDSTYGGGTAIDAGGP
jgi:hypothetical protein